MPPSKGEPGEGTGAERRRFPRVLVNMEVDYAREDTFLFAYIRDISAMGIFVQTTTPEPIGTRLNLRFSPPGASRPLELEGKVIWINPYRPGDPECIDPGMGVQFVDLDFEEREQLTELVRTFAYLGDDAAGAETVKAAGQDESDDDSAGEPSDGD